MDQKNLQRVAGSLAEYYNKVVLRVGGFAAVLVVVARKKARDRFALLGPALHVTFVLWVLRQRKCNTFGHWRFRRCNESCCSGSSYTLAVSSLGEEESPTNWESPICTSNANGTTAMVLS